MRIHPREKITRELERRISDTMIEACNDLDPTYLELIQALNGAIQSQIKYAIRVERHGDVNTPGGEAPDA